MSRQRVGWATESLNLRYADKATELSGVLEEESFNPAGKLNPYELAGLWTATNDARGYVILGDPAVRSPLQGTGAAKPAPGPVAYNTPAAAPSGPAPSAAVSFSVPPTAAAPSTEQPAPTEASQPVAAVESAGSADPSRRAMEQLDKSLLALCETVAQLIARNAANLACGESHDLSLLFVLIELAQGLRKTGV